MIARPPLRCGSTSHKPSRKGAEWTSSSRKAASWVSRRSFRSIASAASAGTSAARKRRAGSASHAVRRSSAGARAFRRSSIRCPMRPCWSDLASTTPCSSHGSSLRRRRCSGDWPSALPASGRALVVVGPEGGFTHAEAELAQRRGAAMLWLGPRVLRTDTAALVLLAVIGAATS